MKTDNIIENSTSRLLNHRFLFFLFLVVVLVFAVILMDYDMEQGPWAFSDSAQYIISGKTLITEGHLGIYAPDGHFMPLTLHPPLYSMILAPFTAINVDIFVVIKWLNILFFCGTIAILSVGIFKITGMAVYGLMAGYMFMVSTSLIKIFDGAMSEPLFVILSVFNLILLVCFLVKPARGTFWGAVITAGLAPLARYIGVVSIGLGFVLLLIFSTGTRGKRLLKAAVYTVVSALPIIAWFVYTYLQNLNLGSRTFNLNIDLVKATGFYKKALMETFANWLPFANSWFPTWENKSNALLAFGSITLVILILVLWKWFKTRDAFGKVMITLISASGLYIIGFLAFLWVTLFSSIQPDYNDRMLSPLLPMIFILLFGVILAGIKAFKIHTFFYLLPVMVMIVLGKSNWIMTMSVVNDHHVNQLGYATPAWRGSPLVAGVRDLPPELTLYSNKADAVLIYTSRYPNSVKLLEANAVQVPTAQTSSILEESNGGSPAALILFTRTLSGDGPESLKGLSPEVSAKLEGIDPYLATPDGNIYLIMVTAADGQSQ